ncbi:MAG TPA: DUF4394 domain-containing protein [Gemmataceae bacterium]|nr:DUF4394 domain-containing protein [Gemmataceae bacterium]
MPSTLYALNATGTAVLRFDSANPGTITNAVKVSGLSSGETLRDLDFRPLNGHCYALAVTDNLKGNDTGRVYELNPLTGVLRPLSPGAPAIRNNPDDGMIYGFDFDPVADVIRVTNSLGQNFRIDPDSGLLLGTDTFRGTPTLAFSRNFEGTPTTTLFGIDLATKSLVQKIGPAFTTVGPLGVSGIISDLGLDIQVNQRTGGDTAFAAMTVDGVAGLYTINLATGSATLVGRIGSVGVEGLAAAPDSIIVVGPDRATGGPHVKVYDALTQTEKFSFFAYNLEFTGGVTVGSGDVNRDGVPDIITGMRCGGSQVKVFDGRNGALIYSFVAYDPAYTLGIYVAGGDVNGDGFDDIITGTAEGGGNRCKVFSGRDLTLLHDFIAYDPLFTGGIRVGAGDIDGDRRADILTGPGEGSGTELRVFSGVDLTLLRSFVVYNPEFTGGLQVTTAFIDGDNRAEVVTGPGVGGRGRLRVFGADKHKVFANHEIFGSQYQGGLRVGATDVNGDGTPEVLGGPTPDRFEPLTILDVTSAKTVGSLSPFGEAFSGGLFIATGR